MQRYAIIEAPSSLGLRSSNVEELAPRLIELGLAERIGARVAASMPPPRARGRRDPDTLILNAPELAEWSPKLADSVESVLDRHEFPLVLGGDCTILLGPMLALRRRGRFGLLFIDGNADFYQPEAEPNGEGASMELAMVTGYAPPLVANLEWLGPLVRTIDTVAFAFRDHDDQAEFGSQPLPPELKALDLAAIRTIGIEAAARQAVEHLTRDELEGFFIHVDVDCLDDAIMPAVRFRIPGGLSWDELATALRIALASGRAVGMEVTIYEPKLDPDGSAGLRLVETLASSLGRNVCGAQLVGEGPRL